jgi:hypothetical protein
MGVDDYNSMALQALQRAQDARGVRSAEAFAKLLAARTGGSPSSSTYHRWLRGESPIPAWVLLAAADEAGESLDALVTSGELRVAAGRRLVEVEDEIGTLRNAIGEAAAEIASAREHTARLVVPELEKQGQLIAKIVADLQRAGIVGAAAQDEAQAGGGGTLPRRGAAGSNA